jgi:agmatinase
MYIKKFSDFTVPFSFWGSNCEYNKAKAVIIPVSFDGTASNQAGSRNAPFVIIKESLETESYDPRFKIDSVNDVFTTDFLEVFNGIKTHEKLFEIVEKIVGDKKAPFVIGGDHSLTPNAVFAIKYTNLEDFTVLCFDAHSDLRKEYRGNERSHACCMRRIRERGNFETIHVGVRSYSKEISEYIKENGVSVFGAGEMELENFYLSLYKLKGKSVYISFDCDVYDYAFCRKSRTWRIAI